MNNKQAKLLVVVAAIFLLLSGMGLYVLFEKQGYGDTKKRNIVTYDIKDYIETVPVIYNDYGNVYDSINVSRIKIKNIANSDINLFLEREEELINYITGYYNEIGAKEDYLPINTATSVIKTQINGTILSVLYEIDFSLDEDIFDDNKRSYIITTNIDLATEKVLSSDDLLSKYNYTKEYISEKIFEEDVLISKGQIVIDKNTNISLTKDDIERKKEIYIDGIINQFDNIIKVYIENNSLAIVYDKKELNGIFFDNSFDTDIKIRYLK